ncbi:MAG TPA: acetyl-CoA carboxylase, carboxyltransferase subunit beta [Candidatus Limnocylindrales bacterium]|nr:acetyl-CoA carboxylase, carboxyltransferase subunit beta [Candidatus Limnocylindrales bacterium]
MPIKLPSFRPRRDAYPPDLWTKCPSCSEMLFNKQLEKSDRVCPTCGHHFRLSAAARLAMLLDPGTFQERDAGLQSVDPLGFIDSKPYPERVTTAQSQTGLRDAAVRGLGAMEGLPVSICVMDFGFMGGSMGAVVGEKVTRAAEDALVNRVPLIVVSASGGARMQEGTLALMQLAKTCAVLERLKAARVPYVSVMSDPTTGGVFASYAVLGDVNLAEPNALIGFAGARVAAGTISQELPPGFQRSEFLFEHGFVDRVVHRRALRGEIAALLRFMRPAEILEVDQRSALSPIGALLSTVVGGAASAVTGAAGVVVGAAGAVADAATGAVVGGNGNASNGNGSSGSSGASAAPAGAASGTEAKHDG